MTNPNPTPADVATQFLGDLADATRAVLADDELFQRIVTTIRSLRIAERDLLAAGRVAEARKVAAAIEAIYGAFL